jgi:hypothetical protein
MLRHLRAVLAGDLSSASRRGKPAWVRAAARRLAVPLACAAFLTAGAAGCASTASGGTTVTATSANSGCTGALQAISTYGPTVLRDAIAAKQTEGRIEISLIVFALDAAADVAGDPGVKQAIRNLANAYSNLRDGWTDAAAPSVESVVANTNRLDSVCGS